MPLELPDTPDPNYQEAFLEYTDATGALKTIIFDAVLSEDWTPNASVTEHPVEKGANVADHVRVGLITCALKVRVTNEPAGSNQFDDPVRLPLALGVDTPTWEPTAGIITVTKWESGRDAAVAIGTAAGVISEAASAVGDKIASSTPLGNLTAKALKPVRKVLANGEVLTSYDVSGALDVGNFPVRSIGDLAGALAFDAISSLAPSGFQVELPVQTTAGLEPRTPVPVITAQTLQFTGGFVDFAAEMEALLIGLMNAATLFTVVGSKGSQASMVIESMPIHRGATEETGTGVEITLNLKQVRLVSTNTVAAPLPSVPRGKTPVNVGAQDPTPADPAKVKSVLLKAFEGAANYFGSGGA